MYLNDFSVRIPEGHETPGGYVEMTHGQQYTLSLRNNRSVRCDAYVEVDGKYVGTWRILPSSNLTLERPAHDTGHFTFYKLGTPESSQAQLNSGSPDLGLVKITFTPERERQVNPWTIKDSESCGVPVIDVSYRGASGGWSSGSACSYMGQSTSSAGGTGLSGHSNQQFVDVGEIDKDYSQQTVIHLRLVCKEPLNTPRPLTSYSTPVPPRSW